MDEEQTSEFKVIILVPVAQGELVQWGSVGKLQVGKMPVQNLAVPWTEVD